MQPHTKRQQISKSKTGKLDSTDWRKIGTGAAVAVLGAILTYATEIIPDLELGDYGPMLAAGLAVLVNVIRKILTDNSNNDDGTHPENNGNSNGGGIFPVSILLAFILFFWMGSGSSPNSALISAETPSVSTTNSSNLKPDPIIVGHTKATTGALIVLKADVVADFYDWSVDTTLVTIPNEEASASLSDAVELLQSAGFTIEKNSENDSQFYVVLDNGKAIVLASYPGTWQVNLAVSNASGVSQRSHKVVVRPIGLPDPPKDPDDGEGDDDDPDPEPDPDPPKPHDFKLGPQIKALIDDIPQATLDREASSVRNALANAADAAFRGDFTTTKEADASVSKAFTDLINQNLLTVKDWKAFGIGINELFSALIASGEIQSVDDWGLALREVVGAM